MESAQHLQVIDYAVFAVILLISLIIGVYHAFVGGRQKTVQEYLLGDRQMGILPISMSLLASFLSAIGMISVPAEIYMFDAGITYSILGMLIAMPVVATCYLPTFYNLQLTSAYEYLERRFNSTLRKIGSSIFIIQMVLYISFALYAPSLVLSQVTGLNLWGSVLTIGILGTVYTSVGGIKAVMWTDVFQIVVMLIALLISINKGAVDVGGYKHVFEKGLEGGRLKLSFNFDLRERYTIWSISMGSFAYWLSLYGLNQILIQRYMSSPKLSKAQLTVLWNVFGNIIFNLCVFVGGLVVYAKYWNCDPFFSGKIKSLDQIFPLFVTESLADYPGLNGLFIAGIFSGTLSTVSSALNSMAAITLEDFIKSFRRWKNVSSERAAFVSKVLSAFYGTLCLALVPAVSNLGPIIQASAYTTHSFGGVICGLFTLGMFVPWANSFGASVGVIVATIFSQWISIGTQITNKLFTSFSQISVDGCLNQNISIATDLFTQTDDIYPFNQTQSVLNFETTTIATANPTEETEIFPLYQISYGWMQLLCALPVVVIGMIASLLRRPTKLENVNLNLLSPVVQYILIKFWPTKLNRNNRDRDQTKQDVLMLTEPHCSGVDDVDVVDIVDDD